MTGRENLRYTARLNGIPDKAEDVASTSCWPASGLPDAGDKKVETYSRGMSQRLGLADVLVKEPSVVILDEPTTSIDPVGVVEVLELVRELAHDRRGGAALQPPAAPGAAGLRPGRHLRARATWSPWARWTRSRPSQQRGAQVELEIGADGDQSTRRAASSRACPAWRRSSRDPHDQRLLDRDARRREARAARADVARRRPATRPGSCATGAWSWTRSTSATSTDRRPGRRSRRRGGGMRRSTRRNRSRAEAPMYACRPTGRIPAGWRDHRRARSSPTTCSASASWCCCCARPGRRAQPSTRWPAFAASRLAAGGQS